MSDIRTAVYYFPNYHADPRNEAVHGKNWTEWELMKHATPRFPGNKQPKVPAWGYEDEADPAVMSRKIDLAAEYGHDAFLFDWYWYEGPFLQRALDEGFLGCGNDKLQFALMWANHDWDNFHPGNRTRPYPVDFYWTTTRETVGFVWDYIIERYLTHPLYFKINGLPYFSIYATNRFISQMGGADAAAKVLADFKDKARAAGCGGVHINAIWADNLDSQPTTVCPTAEWHTRVGFDSYANYNMLQYGHRTPGTEFRVEYRDVLNHYLAVCRKAQETLSAPYFPEVTVGWDSGPRTVQSEVFEVGAYPFYRVMEPTPENLYEATLKLGGTLETFKETDKVLFFNAWNEWTEGSYLEPDTENGFAYLAAIKKALDELRKK